MKIRPPVVAHQQFLERAHELSQLPIQQLFQVIHDTNMWGTVDSVSGPGSELAATATVRAQLPALLRDLDAEVLLDIPCGDFGWLSQTTLPVSRYIGADIVNQIVKRNVELYGREFVQFVQRDLCADELPAADLVLCRDCLVHLSFAHIQQAIRNLKKSRSTWLLTTTFLECEENIDIATGDWRMLNFERAPFHWSPPTRVLIEGCTEADGGYADKALGLWRISELP